METFKKQELCGADSRVVAEEAVKILLEKKGLDVRLYDVHETSAITDFYINVTGRSATHVASLADNLNDELSLRGRHPSRIEGKRGDSWFLVDYNDVIVNIFSRESREFYNLDRLLPADSGLDISDLVAEVDKKFTIVN